mmetsp:Transcript_43635/g.63996  ORF Transcript_43635/g.63996 Transcript_43635/m.63996 type:complete len:193 (+) Transcript_43635:143-721(+)
MALDYSTTGKVRIDMCDYIRKIMVALSDDWTGTAATPTGDHLFKINKDADKLNSDLKELFHHVTAQLLFLSKHVRPNLQTAVAFLTTHVKEPDVDDLKKLQQCINYLRDTAKLVLILESDNLNAIYWWVDAAFAVHHDARSHSGGIMSLGKGAIFSASRKQKLNTKSSTEAELAGVDDMLPQILWTRHFLVA